jgi:hypothetical protein
VEILLKYLKGLMVLLGESEERACLMVRRAIGGSPPTHVDVRMLLGVIRQAYERIASRCGK